MAPNSSLRPSPAEVTGYTPTDLTRRQLVVLSIVVTNAFSLLSFAYKYLGQVAADHTPSPLGTLVDEMTGGYGAALLLWLIAWAAWRLGLPVRGWPSALGVLLPG